MHLPSVRVLRIMGTHLSLMWTLKEERSYIALWKAVGSPFNSLMRQNYPKGEGWIKR